MIFSGVIDLFGSLGGLFTFRSALLASHGFASFALPFFGYDDLPNYGDRIDIEYFEEAIEWFLQHPQVKKDGVGIIAISFSVPLALYVASRMQEKVKGVICKFSIQLYLEINHQSLYINHKGAT